MVLSGRDNILNPGVREGIVVGDGNVIGDGENISLIGSSGNIIGSGCDNVVLINCFDCEVSSGLSNVSMANSSGVIVSDSGVAYSGSAIITPPPSSGDITSIYTLRVELDNSLVTNLDTNEVELLGAKPGFIINVINATMRENVDPNDFSSTGDVSLFNGLTVATWPGVFQFPYIAARYHIAELFTGDQGYAAGREGFNLTIGSNAPITGGPGTITLFITYQYIAV